MFFLELKPLKYQFK